MIVVSFSFSNPEMREQYKIDRDIFKRFNRLDEFYFEIFILRRLEIIKLQRNSVAAMIQFSILITVKLFSF